MSIRMACPSCQASNTLDDDQGGKKVRCRRCDKLFAVPAKRPPEDAIQQGRPAKVGTPRSRKDAADDDARPRPIHKPAGRGFAFALLAVGALALGFCLLIGAAGVGSYLWIAPHEAEHDHAQIKIPDKPAPAGDNGDKLKPDPIPVANPKKPEVGGAFNIAQARKSVVFVKCVTPGLMDATGSGFIVSKDGLIYTNRHVAVPENLDAKASMLIVGVPSAKDPDVLDYFKAELIYAAPEKDDLDFAILKIAAKPAYGEFTPLPLSLAKLDLGAPAAAVGYPAIMDETPPLSFNKGSISATRVLFDNRAFYQTDAAINPGNSGGPLVNAKGEAVGIVTLRKREAQNMGYALYLSEVTKPADEAKKIALASKPDAGPFDVKKMPVLPALAAKKADWHINRGDLIEGRGFLEIDANGGQYWMTSKDPLPDSFQLTIPCQIEGLQGNQRLQPSQFSVLRTLAVRFCTAETDSEILEPKGYLIRFSHNQLVLYREGVEVKRAGRGNPLAPFSFIITRQGPKITIAVGNTMVLEHIDDDPLPGGARFSIGGYTSRLRMAGVSVTKLPDIVVAKKAPVKDPKNDPKEEDRPVPPGGVGNPAPKELFAGDVTLRQLKFSQKKGSPIVGDIVWAKDGKSFFMLQEFGLLQRVNIASGHTEQLLEIGHKCANIAMSGEGLLVANMGASQLWILDPDKLSDIKKKIPVTGISRVSAGVDASIAWAGTPGARGHGVALQAVDLKEGTLLRKHSRWDTFHFTVSPDGKWLMGAGDDVLTRYRILDKDDLWREQTSYRISGNNSRRVCFSPDSKYVALPTGGGNGGGHPDHPAGVQNYATFIYPVHDLRKPVTGYAAGGYPRAVGIDPKTGCILAQNQGAPLIVYSFSADFKLAEYPFKSIPRAVTTEICMSPLGGEAIIRTEEHDIVHVKINKGGPPINTLITDNGPVTTIDNPAPADLADGDVTLRHLTFRKEKEGNIQNGIVWAKDGKSFFMLQERGLIQRVSVATGKSEQFIDLSERCANLAMSGEGLLVSLTDAGELWVLDPDKLGNLKKKIAIPKISHVSSGIDASVAWVSHGNPGPTIQAVDLKMGKLLSANTKHKIHGYGVTPDGKYLFGHNANELSRYRINKDQLILEESGYKIAKGNSRPICFSPDSKFVALPTPGPGNGLGHPDHPELKGTPTYIYPVGNLKRPVSGHVSGPNQNSVGIDPKSGCILAMNQTTPLLVYSFGVDAKLGEHDFKAHRGSSAEFAVSPLGSEAIARTDTGGIILIKINKGGPPVEKFRAADFPKAKTPANVGSVDNPLPVELETGDVQVRNFAFKDQKGGEICGILWAKDGKSFFMLQEEGRLQRVNVASGKTEQFLDIGCRCTSLALSGEGLLVTAVGMNQLWLIDPEQLGTVKKKLYLPAMVRVGAGRDAAIAWVSVPKGMVVGPIVLQAIDLKEGKPLRTYDKDALNGFAVAPDGKYLFGHHQGKMMRYRIDKDDLIQEETSVLLAKLGQGRITFSPDSKYVAMPASNGNETGHADHPLLKGTPTYVYAIDNLKRPAVVYNAGPSQWGVGFDPKSDWILTSDSRSLVKVIRFGVDDQLADVSYKSHRGRPVEFIVSHTSPEAIARTSQGSVLHIKIHDKSNSSK